MSWHRLEVSPLLHHVSLRWIEIVMLGCKWVCSLSHHSGFPLYEFKCVGRSVASLRMFLIFFFVVFNFNCFKVVLIRGIVLKDLECAEPRI